MRKNDVKGKNCHGHLNRQSCCKIILSFRHSSLVLSAVILSEYTEWGEKKKKKSVWVGVDFYQNRVFIAILKPCILSTTYSFLVASSFF